MIKKKKKKIKNKLYNTNISGWKKNITTGAVINTNVHEYEIYKEKVANYIKTQSLQNEVSDLRHQLNNMQELMQKFINGNNNV